MSVPFYGEEFIFTQPDGTEFQVRGWGDQFNARFETLGGVSVVQNPSTGFYEQTTFSENGDEIHLTGTRAEARNPDPIPLSPNNRAAAKVRAQLSSGLLRGTTRWEERRHQSKIALRNAMVTPDGIAPAPPQRKTIGKYVDFVC